MKPAAVLCLSVFKQAHLPLKTGAIGAERSSLTIGDLQGSGEPSRITQPYPEMEVKRVFSTLGTYGSSYRGTSSNNDPDPHNTQGGHRTRSLHKSHPPRMAGTFLPCTFISPRILVIGLLYRHPPPPRASIEKS